MRFRAPVASPARLEVALLRQLDAIAWRGGVSAASAQVVRSAELSVQQEDLFFDAETGPGGGVAAARAEAVVAALSRQYPGALLRYRTLDATHPAAERRGEFVVREPDGGSAVERAKALPVPVALTVVADADGRPVRLGEGDRTFDVQSIDATWRVCTDWWSEAGAVDRTCYALTLADGATTEVFFDHLAGGWRWADDRRLLTEDRGRRTEAG